MSSETLTECQALALLGYSGHEQSESPRCTNPVEAVRVKYPEARNNDGSHYADTYQRGIKPGKTKLLQFIEVLDLMQTPPLYGNEGKEGSPLVCMKLFNPSGVGTWYITEFSRVAPDGCENLAFGLCDLGDPELGYVSIEELSNFKGPMGIGIEIDMHFKPITLAELREKEGI